jgi:hypothetical protein
MTPEEMNALTSTMATKADKIRALHVRGLKRREIAEYLGVLPQYVGNIVSRHPVLTV